MSHSECQSFVNYQFCEFLGSKRKSLAVSVFHFAISVFQCFFSLFRGIVMSNKKQNPWPDGNTIILLPCTLTVNLKKSRD